MVRFNTTFAASDVTFVVDFSPGSGEFETEFKGAVEVKVLPDPYEGSYSVTPAVTAQVLPTAGKSMAEDMTVLAVPYYQASNQTGDTVYIASEVD